MKRFLIISALYVLCCACFAQQWHTTLDVLRPAVKDFPRGVADMLIVNNTVKQPDDFGHALVLFGNNKGNQTIDLAQAATRALFAATQHFDESGLFSSVGLVNRSMADGTFFAGNSLSRKLTDSLCLAYNSDAVLALDRILIYDREELYLGDDYNYYAYLQVYVTTSWTLTTRSGSFSTLTRSDTLLWEGSSYDSNLAFDKLPDRQTALLDVAEYAGEQFAIQFIPQWETVDRYLYENSDSLLTEGMRHFTCRRWQQAVRTWQQCYDLSKQAGKKSKTNLMENCAYAAADIAVTCEILGDLAQARQWAKLSIEAFSKMQSADAAQQQVNMTFYLQELEQRQKDETKLSSQ